MAGKIKAGGWRWYRGENYWRIHPGTAIEFMVTRPFIVSKRRWASRALEEAGVEHPERWAAFDLPGTNLTLFTPGPIVHGETEFAASFLASQYRYKLELDAVLDTPVSAEVED